MKALKWIGCYFAAIVIGSVCMMLMHHISGFVFPEAAISEMPQGDPEALKKFMAALGIGPKISVLLSHWLGTAAGAAVAMRLAPVSVEWLRSASLLKSTFPGGLMGFWFIIGGVANAMMVPMPRWMVAVDLLGYLPFALLISRRVVIVRTR